MIAKLLLQPAGGLIAARVAGGVAVGEPRVAYLGQLACRLASDSATG